MANDLLFEDYRIKVDYLKSQYDRLWTRFHFFLTVELAIFGFLGYLTFNHPSLDVTVLPIAMGFFVSLLWYIVGAEDRALVEVYEERARTAAAKIADDRVEMCGYELDNAAVEVTARWRGLRSWYWPRLSITRIPVTIALLLLIVWLVLFMTWGKFARAYLVTHTKVASLERFVEPEYTTPLSIGSFLPHSKIPKPSLHRIAVAHPIEKHEDFDERLLS
jgi:hypothetical protein